MFYFYDKYFGTDVIIIFFLFVIYINIVEGYIIVGMI